VQPTKHALLAEVREGKGREGSNFFAEAMSLH